ncbi:Magnesium-chelatase 38 kDa subunit [subsurface metagenome]
MHRRIRLVYPFSTIVGQENMKKALLLNAINPKIGGVLLRGEKGTAKSMAVRALAQLLPQIEVVSDCPFLCEPECADELCDTCAARAAKGEKLGVARRQVPVVEMPIGATEDRVVGTLDIERAIKTGEKHFEPGLLAAANRGILYIDEVNLLDVLLDAAAMGVNFVEREGISFSHPAQFILVGTMNPEEGELRPQLLDRFGLAVEVKGIPDQESRAEVVRRRIAFEANPAAFVTTWEGEQERIRQQVMEAKKLLPGVQLSEEMLKLITQICIDFAVDGHRADIVIHKTATTIAAYYGRIEVNEEDVKEAAELALLHRRRRQPFEQPELNQQQLEESVQRWHQNQENQPQDKHENEQAPPPSDPPPHNDTDDCYLCLNLRFRNLDSVPLVV